MQDRCRRQLTPDAGPRGKEFDCDKKAGPLTGQTGDNPRQAIDAGRFAFTALALGATAMGASPLFLRLAEIGPFAGAFWRVALALPVLYFWARLDDRQHQGFGLMLPRDRLVVAAGIFFAGDLVFWHLAILNTTVANATFLAALAPVAVVIGAWALLGEAIGQRTIVSMALSLAGAAMLLGSSYSFRPENLPGDISGLVTACFFGAYFLVVRPARLRLPAGVVIFQSSLVTAAILLVIAIVSAEPMLPASLKGAAFLLTLGLVSHAGGQGLLAFALGHLPAGFSSLVIFLEGVAAALLGWLFLGEGLGILQFAGCALIVASLFWTRPRKTPIPMP
ncbi:MAG: DMT family transporter [Rhodobiaceae bacterium]|nr:DMT family transporter [Rhodobiaceae bacterium]MCC0057218.1 DMT family transporter [Rhodobiaceae bacterium]